MKFLFLICAIAGSAHAVAQTFFTNHADVRIPGIGTGDGAGVPAGVHPITFLVSGMGATTTDINITLEFGTSASTFDISLGEEHSFCGDLDVMLVSPTGTSLVFLSDAGSLWDLNGSYTFDDEAAAPIHIDGTGQNDGISNLLSGSYRFSQYGAGDPFSTPAPSPDFANITFTAFDGANPNGVWEMYIMDDAGGDAGWLMSSTLEVTAVPEPATLAALGLGAAALMRKRRTK